MRHWMSVQTETTRTRQTPQRLRPGLSVPPEAECLLVSAREVALRIGVRSLVARDRGTGDQTEAAPKPHVGPGRAGVAHHDWLGHPDLSAALSEQGRTAGKSTLHPDGPRIAGRRGRPAPADLAPPDALSDKAASAVCLREPGMPRPGRATASPAIGTDITAGAGRGAGGGRGPCP
jgi:hypothetical protein